MAIFICENKTIEKDGPLSLADIPRPVGGGNPAANSGGRIPDRKPQGFKPSQSSGIEHDLLRIKCILQALPDRVFVPPPFES